MEYSIEQKQEGSKGKFFLKKAQEKVAHVEYRMEDDHTLVVEYTEVVPSFRNTGTGAELVDRVLRFAESENLKLKSECGYFSHKMKTRE